MIWANRYLWQGIGYVPGPNLEMYSGLAEAYGLYMVLSFFQRYLATFPLVIPPNLTIRAYCDNKGIVDRLNRQTKHLYPRDTIQDDYPIIGEIQQTIRNLEPILVQIDHVKGHQDKVKLDRPLTIQETLNIECDKRASDAMTTFPHTTPRTHPTTSIGYPHLILDGEVQFRKLQHRLRDAATAEEYQTYLQEKFQWTEDQYQSIHWNTFYQAYY